MKEIKKLVKKITIATCFITFVGTIITKDFLRDIAHQFIKQEYELMNKTNSTSIHFSFDPEQFWIRPDSFNTSHFKPYEITFGNEHDPFFD
mgnify:CR=1 FL=1